MEKRRPHWLVYISAHGFGHAAQTLPVLHALRARIPALTLTVVSALPAAYLAARLPGAFTHVRRAPDIGMVMSSALDVDVVASAAAYHRRFLDREAMAAQEAHWMTQIAPDGVLSNVADVPLAAARRAGIPGVALCSLNWADIYRHYCGHVPGSGAVAAALWRSYAEADAFLCLEPAMPMADLPRRVAIGPVAGLGREDRDALRRRLGVRADTRLVLVSLGGLPGGYPQRWPALPRVRWLIPGAVYRGEAATVPLETLGVAFPDLLASSDALVCKPGYGSFVEAACHGIPVLTVARGDWPETPVLTAWLRDHGHCVEVGRAAFEGGDFGDVLQTLLDAARSVPVAPCGVDEAAQWLAQFCAGRSMSIASP